MSPLSFVIKIRKIPSLLLLAAMIVLSILLVLPHGAAAQGNFLWMPSNWRASAPNQSYYYEITVNTTGVLRNVNLGLPAGTGTSANLTFTTSIGGGATLIKHGNYIEYKVTKPYTVGAGWKLKITIIGLVNPPASKNLTFQSTAWSTSNAVLTNAISYPVSFALPPVFPAPVAYPVADQPCTSAPYTIADENRRPGQASGVTKSITTAAEVEGFADRVSATCGQLVTMRVRVTDGSLNYKTEVFRMGYYGGVGSRLVNTVSSSSVVAQPVSYTIPQLSVGDGTVREMIATNWKPGASFRVGSDWVPGAYRIRLTSSKGSQVIIPLIIRDDASTSEYLVVNGFNTYQAYNSWGGTSLYANTLPAAVSASAKRAAVVASYDRPYAGGTDGRYDWCDYGFASWAEEKGLAVSYTTDNDLDRLGSTLSQHRTLVLLAHAEYWTDRGRAAVADAVNGGMNLINLGTNQFYWRIEQQPGIVSKSPNRSVYTSRSGSTGLFRANGLPEQAILGSQYTGGWGAYGDVLVANNWLFAGTNLAPGTKVPNLIYDEVDQVDPAYSVPAGTTVLAHSELSLYQNQPVRGHFHDMTFHIKPSGARVFSAGTLGWSSGLIGRFGIPAKPMRQMMQNVIDQIRATGPAPSAGAQAANGLKSQSPSTTAPRIIAPLSNVTVQQ